MSSRIFNGLDVIKLEKSTTPKYKNYKDKYELVDENSVKANQLFIGEFDDKKIGLFLYIDGDVRSVSYDDTTYGFVKNEIEYVNDLLSKLQFPHDEEDNASEKYEGRLNNFLGVGDNNA